MLLGYSPAVCAVLYCAVLYCGVMVSLRLQAKNQREGLSSERYLVLPSNVSSDPYTTLRYVTHSTRKHST